jgi:hypothetical protein
MSTKLRILQATTTKDITGSCIKTIPAGTRVEVYGPRDDRGYYQVHTQGFGVTSIWAKELSFRTLSTRDVHKLIYNVPGISFHNMVKFRRTMYLYDYAHKSWTPEEWKHVTEDDIKNTVEILRAHFEPGALKFLDATVPVLRKAITKGSSIVSFKFYPEFRILVLLGDGFPVARFGLNEAFNKIYCAYVDTKPAPNAELLFASNPNGIPTQFPIEDFPKHIAKIHV